MNLDVRLVSLESVDALEQLEERPHQVTAEIGRIARIPPMDRDLSLWKELVAQETELLRKLRQIQGGRSPP